MHSTIALFGSSRRNGNTGQLIDWIARELDIEIIDLAARKLSAYDYEHRNRGDDFEPLMEYLLRFDQWIFASPVYWYAVTPPMKVFLDRVCDYLDLPELLEHGRRLRGKRAYVVCTSIEKVVSSQFIGAFRDTFAYLGMSYGGFVHADCRDGYRPGDHKNDVKEFVQRVGNGEFGHSGT